MAPTLLASISLAWDEQGRITSRFAAEVPVDDYKRQDGIALSAVLIACAQLGVLSPQHSVPLCASLLDFIEEQTVQYQPIAPPLQSARIDLLWKDSGIVHTFHPEIVPSGNMDVEVAISHLITNYINHVSETVLPELTGYLRHTLLACTLFLLQEALLMAARTRPRDPSASNMEVQLAMLQFSETIYPQWGGLIPKANFTSLLSEAHQHFAKTRKTWGL